MIAIKTRMRRIPPCCQQCQLYINGRMYGDGCCGGVIEKAGFPKALFDVTITKKRADFCPLVEIKEREAQHGKKHKDRLV